MSVLLELDEAHDVLGAREALLCRKIVASLRESQPSEEAGWKGNRDEPRGGDTPGQVRHVRAMQDNHNVKIRQVELDHMGVRSFRGAGR